jgi:hypothetical protein
MQRLFLLRIQELSALPLMIIMVALTVGVMLLIILVLVPSFDVIQFAARILLCIFIFPAAHPAPSLTWRWLFVDQLKVERTR